MGASESIICDSVVAPPARSSRDDEQRAKLGSLSLDFGLLFAARKFLLVLTRKRETIIYLLDSKRQQQKLNQSSNQHDDQQQNRPASEPGRWREIARARSPISETERAS